MWRCMRMAGHGRVSIQLTGRGAQEGRCSLSNCSPCVGRRYVGINPAMRPVGDCPWWDFLAQSSYTRDEADRLMSGTDFEEAKKYAQANRPATWKAWLLDSGLVAPCSFPVDCECDCILRN